MTELIPPIRTELKLISIGRQSQTSFWNEIKSQSRFLTNWGINLLKEGLLDKTKSVFIEYPYICKDHKNVYSNYYSKQYRIKSHLTERIHFFNSEIEDPFLLGDFEFSESYIGFSVIRPVKERCIGKTFIDPMKIFPKDHTHFVLRAKRRTHFLGKNQTISAFPFISQEKDVTVCAHSSLWSVCRFLSTKYNMYKEIYPFDIVQLASSDHGRTFPYHGLTWADYSQILTTSGAYPELFILDKTNNEDALQYIIFVLYSYVESGFPLIASLRPIESSRHSINVIGHTIDYDIVKDEYPKLNKNEFISSTTFIDSFIIQDDNKFPYQYLVRDICTKRSNFHSSYNIESIIGIICPLPEKIFLSAGQVQILAEGFTDTYKDEINEVFEGPYITRTFLTTCTAFTRSKMNDGYIDEDELGFYCSQLNLPHFCWITEICTFEQYLKNEQDNGEIFAEIVYDATAGIDDDALLYYRIGNKLNIPGNEPIPGNMNTFPVFKHNLSES
jgi:hypothetical protein